MTSLFIGTFMITLKPSYYLFFFKVSSLSFLRGFLGGNLDHITFFSHRNSKLDNLLSNRRCKRIYFPE